jgi:hypothetical protein
VVALPSRLTRRAPHDRVSSAKALLQFPLSVAATGSGPVVDFAILVGDRFARGSSCRRLGPGLGQSA